MLDKIELRSLKSTMGCGIYEVGNPDTCYVRLFVTDSGWVLPVNHRVIVEEDLMEAYKRGVLDGSGWKPAPSDMSDEDSD